MIFPEYGMTSRARNPEAPCGDNWVVRHHNNAVLFAVIDGIGHGQSASESAKTAVAVLEKAAAGVSLVELLDNCHEALKKKAGCVMTLISVSPAGTVAWTGVGNVMLLHWHHVLFSKTKLQEFVAAPGIVGSHLPSLTAAEFTAESDDVIVMATDGISQSALMAMNPDRIFSPQLLAEKIFSDCWSASDDGLVLVIHMKENSDGHAAAN